MKLRSTLLLYMALLLSFAAAGQPNCSIITNPDCAKACRIYNDADSFYQGSAKSQHYFDSAISICPGFADAWNEKSVPFLKRGDFVTWRLYMDKAVELSPAMYLPVRGWCRFKFLKDYEGALADLKRNDTLSRFCNQYSGDGNYELHVIMAICERELGNCTAAFNYFARGIDSVVARRGKSSAGLYSYLHLGVTRLRINDLIGARLAFEQQNSQYDKFAETYYYMGLIDLKTGNKVQAAQNLGHALDLFTDKRGMFRLNDPYCEMTDAVYLADIMTALELAK